MNINIKYLKRTLLCISFFLPGTFSSIAQKMENFGSMYVDTAGNMGIHIDLVNEASATLKNAGNIYAFYNVRQDGLTGYDGGALRLVGNSLQTIDGAEDLKTTNIYFDNGSGFSQLNTVSVSKNAYFENGIVNATDSAEPLEFNPNGLASIAIAAIGVSDSSHVNGYVSQTGIGMFNFPVGDGTRYQVITVGIGANPSGLRTRYFPEDAGSATFLTTGLDLVPLAHYNEEEYWEIKPVGGDSALVLITVHYDNYNNTGIGPGYATDLKVAHQTSSGWQNEGGIVSGNEYAGTVTSIAAINNRGHLFTLGSISEDTPLPVTLTYFSASVENCDITVQWSSASESAGVVYSVEYSLNGRDYSRAGSINPLGSNSDYSFTHRPDATGQMYYRLAMQEPGGDYEYSKTVPVLYDCKQRNVTAYPNPLKNGNSLTVTLNGYNQANALIYDVSGRVVQDNILLHQGENTLTNPLLAPGLYWLIVATETQTYPFKIIITQ